MPQIHAPPAPLTQSEISGQQEDNGHRQQLIAFIAASWTPSRYAGRVLDPRRWARLVIVASIAVPTTACHSNEEPDQVAAYYI